MTMTGLVQRERVRQRLEAWLARDLRGGTAVDNDVDVNAAYAVQLLCNAI